MFSIFRILCFCIIFLPQILEAVEPTLTGLNIQTTSHYNIGIGYMSAPSCTGKYNVGIGHEAMQQITAGDKNLGLGCHTLHMLTTGTGNIALGCNALKAVTDPNHNVGIGMNSLHTCITGSHNIGIGTYSGCGLTTGSHNIYIGHELPVPASDESNTIRIGTDHNTTKCYIPSITNSVLTRGRTRNIKVDSNGKIGVIGSSSTYKDNIANISTYSNLVSNFASLAPKTFQYIDDTENNTLFGLIAEDVESLYPELVIYDKTGNILTINYEMLIPILIYICQQQALDIATLQSDVAALQANVFTLQTDVAELQAVS